MRQLTILVILLFSTQTIFSQNIEECTKVVNTTIEAINSNSLEKLEPYLSENFKIAKQKGKTAKLILSQLFTQLNVESFEKKSSNKENETLTLKYNFKYEYMGNKEVTFTFNKENELIELQLLKMRVEKNSKSNVIKNSKNVTKIPFEMSGKLIMVDVMLNGKKRKFILDSGAPQVILNSRYTAEKDTTEKRILSLSKGVSGNISGMDIQQVKSLDFAGIQLKNEKVITLDISHLEQALDNKIYGLIGYDLIKDYDILFDYENKEIILINPDYYEKYKNKNFSDNKLTIVPFSLENHIPVVKALIDKKEYSLGIDCGAESNLLDDELFEEMQRLLKNNAEVALTGAGKNKKSVKKAKLKKLYIGNKKFKNLITVSNNISHLNEGYKINIDGLIGYEVLSRQKTLMSYKRKELIFIE